MEYVVYIFGALFFFLSFVLLFAYYRTRHAGMLLMAVAYGASAGLAIVIMHWWPLLAGFALVWILRLLGLDPGLPREPSQ
ncbi:MAG: hypothetical protein HY323_02905 [Betaproteobacteria bacterium]|nr:hypothetical protein [Betaproteobacteria bacterium]MBI3935900.1 hypothetical protein [Betaproteobacteria bacterium]